VSAFILIPGAGGAAWTWHRVVPLLEEAGHEAIAVELPGDDPDAGLEAYAERVIEAIGARRDLVLVAQSLGGFTAPLVCARAPVRMLVLVNAMIPVPGETAGAWGDHTGSGAARTAAARAGGYPEDFDEAAYFFHDVPPEIVAAGEAHERAESERIFEDVCRFAAWPRIPIHVIAGRDDRLFPIDFQRRVARDRLKVSVDEVAGGHLVALSNPRGLVERLLGYLRA
jgi:pimeloyl-ACP methyl ester carboxylesterase